MNHEITISTDVATIAFFDPIILDSHRNDAADWWACSFEEISEINDGLVTFVSTGSDGVFSIKITTGELTELEKIHAVDVIDNLGVKVSSEKLYIGDGINIPGGGYNSSTEKSISFPNGNYKLTIYAINQPDDGTLPDVIAIISPRDQNDQIVTKRLMLEWDNSNYLFNPKPKLKLGKVLSGKVWKTNRTESGLIIKDSEYSWPDSHSDYDAILEDMSQVNRGDKVKIKTIAINEEEDLLVCELISRTPKE